MENTLRGNLCTIIDIVFFGTVIDVTCRVCTRRNSQCIDDKTDTTNNATTTTYHATTDNPQHDKQPHHTTPLTNTHQHIPTDTSHFLSNFGCALGDS